MNTISFIKDGLIKTSFRNLFAILVLPLFFGAITLNAQESMRSYTQGTDTLVVYNDVPGYDILPERRLMSDKYSIRIRSAATNNEWVDVFALYTYNRWNDPEFQNPPILMNGNQINYHYQTFTDQWSHTYGNIEMSRNTAVEVEIAFINGFTIKGQPIFKAAAHPSQKVSSQPVVSDGKIYFTINNPGQIIIDINGQMDDHNAAINPMPLVNGKKVPVHAISLFANPLLKKPSLAGLRTHYVEPNADTAITLNLDPATYDTLYFKPGIHNLGLNFKLQPGKKYYIPGDAIVYASFNNMNMPVSVGGLLAGENIRMYGYGTISQWGIQHPNYVPGAIDNEHAPIFIGLTKNTEIYGLTIADPSMHSVKLQYDGSRADKSAKLGFCRWMKIISWRSNGDGIGSAHVVEDCFLRTADDASYIKGDRIRTIFWRDVHAAGFHMAAIPEVKENFPILIEDCEAIYHRSRDVVGYNGAIFHQRGSGAQGQREVNVTVRNFKSSDPRANSPFFSLLSQGKTSIGSSFTGITFQNISIESDLIKNRMLGCVESPWFGGIIFDNVTINGVKLTEENFNTYFETNEFVKDIWFRMPGYFTITPTTDANQGAVTVDPVKTTYIENSIATLTAVGKPGYEFVSWTGDTTAVSNPLLLKMTGNKTITANFVAVGAKSLTITPALNGTIVSNPAGSSQTTNSMVTLTAKPAIGYKFDSWSGDITGSAIVTTFKMDADKAVSANFVKTNNFAINGGGDQYIAADGTVYAFTGTAVPKTNPISGTDDPLLYQTERWNATFSYDIPVDNGDYTVTLKFAEIHFTAAAKRVFNVAIEGIPVISNFDIFVEAGGANKAIDKTFKTTVSDGILNIAFTSVVNNAKISAIKVVNDHETSVKNINAKSAISVYPNPATDKLFFNSADMLVDKIQLVDLTGKIVYSANVQLQNGSVDLSAISRGMYLVRFFTRDYNITSKITIK